MTMPVLEVEGLSISFTQYDKGVRQRSLPVIRDLDLNGKPLSVMPNAGYPTVLGRRVVYQGQPAYFAMQMAQIVRAGASIVGGCCGTTPDHIAKVADMLSRPLP